MKKFIAMLFVVCIVFSLCACGSSGGSGESLTFATGGESGTYYAFGSVLAQYVSNNTDIKITAVVGNGSQANVEDLDSGAVQLGFCQSDVMSYAYSGTNLFAESGAVDSFSVAAALYMEQVQIVTTNPDIKTVEDLKGKTVSIGALDSGAVQLGFCQSDVMSYAYSGTNLFAESGAVDSFSVAAALYMEQVQIVTTNPDIKTVEDLKGKTVSIGALGSGVYFNAVDVLGVYGIDAEKDITPVYQSFGDSAESLKDGKIDAAFIVAGAPTTAITDLATASSVYLVSIDDEHMDTLLASSPYYARSTISADTYGTPDDVQTVAVAAVVLVRDDVSADAVYKFVSTIFENSGSIQHGKAEELSVEFGSSITAVPYHPGAAKYFAEKGIEVATK